MVKIQNFVKGLSKKLPQFDRECRRQSLKNACPDARMCRRCFYGPMEKSNCSNLQTHSHQYQNACPDVAIMQAVGGIASWDGRLAEETKVHVAKEEGLKSIVDKVPRRISVAESPDFFLHIQYPIEGYLLIQPSLGDRIIPLAISYKSTIAGKCCVIQMF